MASLPRSFLLVVKRSRKAEPYLPRADAYWDTPSTSRRNQNRRAHQPPEEADVRCRVPMDAYRVLDAIDIPNKKDVTSIRALTMPCDSLDMRTVLWTHVQNGSPMLDVELARSCTTEARLL